MADNITYRFIQNVGDYFPSGYFTDDFIDKVQKCAGRSSDEMKELCTPFVRLRQEYEDYKNFIVNANPRVKDAIARTHQWHTSLLKVLGYDTEHAYQEPFVVAEKDDITEMIPVRHILRSGDNISMLVMEMQHLISIDDNQPAGLFEQQYDDGKSTGQQRYWAGQWSEVIPAKFLDKEHYRFCPAIINKAVTQIFLMPEERRPHFILMLAGNTIFLFDKEKWARGSYLQFSLDDLYTQAQIKNFRLHYALFHLLVCKDTLSADGQTVLMDALIEESYKNAYEVTKDLKEGVILAIETLANEALYYMQHVAHRPFGKKKLREDGTEWFDETDDDFEAEVKDDCLTIVYRLLFILFAESRPELDILPTNDEVYKLGYSFEALRDLEQVRLVSQESRDGYFFDSSIRHLFRVLSMGYHPDMVEGRSFSVRPIDSPMFNDGRLKQLQDVKIRNVKWQEIVRALSLSRGKKYSGRISYANLGVNQLGSVYESLLAYRGFYAEEDYIEVYKPGKLEEGTFLVPYSRMNAFRMDEVLTDEETGEPRILPRGTFVYRLNGRDRQKSASYYTPEVLTKSTVKYTIKAIVDEVREGKRKAADLLDLKILEPAVGAAAFLNEAINQLAEAYMTHVEKKPSPDHYRDELQKVKAYIATHNVYGVDLNPTAIELGKLSLWLNVIHKDMETPFFANRLTVGNAVIGAWLKTYSRQDVLAKVEGKKLVGKEWWTVAPHKVKFYQNRVNRSVNDVYHFLLPDKNMLGVLSIKEQKKAHPQEAKLMAERLKQWTAPINSDDFRTLQKLSAKIDVLLREAVELQVNIERLTNNRRDIWPHEATQTSLFQAQELAENYAEKERIFDSRYGRDNAYYKLKLVMDYWCALWFWEYEDAAALPTRMEYWQEIDNLLAVSDNKLDYNTRRAMERGENTLNLDFGSLRMTEEEAGIVEKSKREILESTTAQLSLFAEPERFRIAERLAARYHFFHPMLEFIEVFWIRDGFDVILGNPPWLKYEFDEKGVISEKYPEVAIRKVSTPDVRKMIVQFLENPTMADIYHSEQNEQACSTTFMNGYCNYPLLVGQKTNLYKCVLENTFSIVNDEGYIGLLTPEGIYNDPKGQPLRRELYKHLRYHFQYENELNLFEETNDHGRMRFGCSVCGTSKEISFININNVFNPNTVDACFAHDGHGMCGGIKDENSKWNTAAHKDRLVHFGGKEIELLSNTFEDGTTKDSAKLVSIHSEAVIDVLKQISSHPKHLKDYDTIISMSINETHGVDDGIMVRDTHFPDVPNYDMIYSGPHFNLANPLSKNPKTICLQSQDYDLVDLATMPDDYLPRMNYRPIKPITEYKSLFKGFPKGQDEDGNTTYDCWLDYYKLAFRRMMGPTSERTLICAVLQRSTAHINTVISSSFVRGYDCVDMAALCQSLVLDFYIKTIGAVDLFPSRMQSFPLGVAERFNNPLRARALRLNCLTNGYADLWQDCWNEAYKQDQWSIDDPRLAPWSNLTEQWQHSTPLRNYFERRMALVEIDVIAAMALGLSLKDLEMMYNIQFPVLQQNENDTWYDAKGNIVFTCSKGLTGVGLDRPTWNAMRGEATSDGMQYFGTSETYVHTIDPKKSELYGGQQVTYYAPYNRMDRIADYRRAWAHFEKIFADKND